jgi:hypothetical protein
LYYIMVWRWQWQHSCFYVIRVFLSELLEKNTNTTVFKKSNMVLCS